MEIVDLAARPLRQRHRGRRNKSGEAFKALDSVRNRRTIKSVWQTAVRYQESPERCSGLWLFGNVPRVPRFPEVPGVVAAAAPSPWLRSSLRSFLRHGSGAPRPRAHELAGFVAIAPLRPVRPGDWNRRCWGHEGRSHGHRLAGCAPFENRERCGSLSEKNAKVGQPPIKLSPRR